MRPEEKTKQFYQKTQDPMVLAEAKGNATLVELLTRMPQDCSDVLLKLRIHLHTFSATCTRRFQETIAGRLI